MCPAIIMEMRVHKLVILKLMREEPLMLAGLEFWASVCPLTVVLFPKMCVDVSEWVVEEYL